MLPAARCSDSPDVLATSWGKAAIDKEEKAIAKEAMLATKMAEAREKMRRSLTLKDEAYAVLKEKVCARAVREWEWVRELG